MAGTMLTHLVGWPLVALNFRQQRFEADFRFNLVRVRENAGQIALLGGETAERKHLLERFGHVVANWLLIMERTKRLTFLTSGYTQISTVFPFIVISPAYFSGAVALGGLMQTASAFNSVQTALSYFITAYRQLAEWRAVIARLEGFNDAVAKAQAAKTTQPAIAVVESALARMPSRSKTCSCGCRKECPWSPPTTLPSPEVNACWSPVRPGPASRPCFERSPAPGHSGPAP